MAQGNPENCRNQGEEASSEGELLGRVGRREGSAKILLHRWANSASEDQEDGPEMLFPWASTSSSAASPSSALPSSLVSSLSPSLSR